MTGWHFEREQKIRFQHCDPHGIVFYPRYFEMINATVEDWFDTVLGVDFAELHGPRRAGVPMKTIATEFFNPGFLGETLRLVLAVRRIGRTSMQLEITALGKEDKKFSSELVIIHVDKDSGRPQPWTDDILERLPTPAEK